MIPAWRGRWAAILLSAAAVAAVAAAAGCTTAPAASVAASPTAVVAPPSTSSTLPPTTPPPSEEPSTVPSAEPDDSLEPPPVATLVAGGVRHAGEAGSWVWAQGSSDSPWLPAQALDRADVAAGPVSVELAGDVAVDSWSAVVAAADDSQGVDVELFGDGTGDPAFEVSAGAWVVAVDVRFADGLGSATYYWHLVVT